jgi:hypothetical protein
MQNKIGCMGRDGKPAWALFRRFNFHKGCSSLLSDLEKQFGFWAKQNARKSLPKSEIKCFLTHKMQQSGQQTSLCKVLFFSFLVFFFDAHSPAAESAAAAVAATPSIMSFL